MLFTIDNSTIKGKQIYITPVIISNVLWIIFAVTVNLKPIHS